MLRLRRWDAEPVFWVRQKHVLELPGEVEPDGLLQQGQHDLDQLLSEGADAQFEEESDFHIVERGHAE